MSSGIAWKKSISSNLRKAPFAFWSSWDRIYEQRVQHRAQDRWDDTRGVSGYGGAEQMDWQDVRAGKKLHRERWHHKHSTAQFSGKFWDWKIKASDVWGQGKNKIGYRPLHHQRCCAERERNRERDWEEVEMGRQLFLMSSPNAQVMIPNLWESSAGHYSYLYSHLLHHTHSCKTNDVKLRLQYQGISMC